MLEFEVSPEKSLKNEYLYLILGMSLNQIMQSLQQLDCIRNIYLCYSDKNPLTGDIVLFLKNDGLRLVFDPMTQRLKLIEITDLSKVKLKYQQTFFCSQEIVPTRDKIEETFGATYPVEYDNEDKMIHLKFRGLCFSFDNNSKTPDNANGVWSNNQGHRSAPVSKMSIYTGTCHKNPTTPPLPLSSTGNSVFLKNLNVIRDPDQNVGKGRTLGVEVQIVYWTERSSEQTDVTRKILFGDTVSDVVSALGSPSQVFYKETDKMRIHSPNPPEDGEKNRSDYFYNYFTLGLDVLFDAKRHTAKKIIIHTNFPGHIDFNHYHRCNFSMMLPTLDGREKILPVITFTKWDEIFSRLVTSEEKPVVLSRGEKEEKIEKIFGATHCYGCCNDIIIEVISKNSHIASVTLFDSTFPS